jgi:hypothetical protein
MKLLFRIEPVINNKNIDQGDDDMAFIYDGADFSVSELITVGGEVTVYKREVTITPTINSVAVAVETIFPIFWCRTGEGAVSNAVGISDPSLSFSGSVDETKNLFSDSFFASLGKSGGLYWIYYDGTTPIVATVETDQLSNAEYKMGVLLLSGGIVYSPVFSINE